MHPQREGPPSSPFAQLSQSHRVSLSELQFTGYGVDSLSCKPIVPGRVHESTEKNASFRNEDGKAEVSTSKKLLNFSSRRLVICVFA